MIKSLSETKNAFDAITGQMPTPKELTDDQRMKYFQQVYPLLLEAKEHGTAGEELYAAISDFLMSLLPSINKNSQVLFEKVSNRIQENHPSDGAMLASAPRKW